MRIISKILVKTIKFYQKYKTRSYPVCKYYPSCSDYAIISIEKYGPIKGTLKAIWRIIRCNPFSKGGVDLP
ncbi:MAG: membrane protein insertion efficiency factor YidD [bacterium]